MSNNSVPEAGHEDHASDGAGTSASDQTQSSIAPVITKIQKHFASRQGIAPLNQIIGMVTRAFINHLDPVDPPDADLIEQQLLAFANAIITGENAKAEGHKALAKQQLSTVRVLTPWQISQILLSLHHIKRIAPAAKDTDREYDLLAMYQPDGPGKGTYTTSEDDIRMIARRYNLSLSLNDFKEVLATLKESAPRTQQSTHRDLCAVDNGIFHYGVEPMDLTVNGIEFHFEPKSIHPFDPALIFLSKCHIAYHEQSSEVVITNPDDGSVWEVVEWMNTLSDDPEIVDLLWEIIGAIIRPHVRWNKTAWFYSEKGNNGKGTLCALMRNLCGPRAHTSIPLTDFGKDFALEPLVRASAIIVDENDVGTFIDKAANLKAVVTGDVIQINRKHRIPIAYQFFGFMVQCLNEFPRVKDKSESFYRRQLFVPFTKSFTGRERRYIKDDYLQRPEVLEYVLWYVLNRAGTDRYKTKPGEGPGRYYELSEPPATQNVLDEYKEVNDPVRAFWEEFRERFVWDLLPFSFAYDLYKAWFPQVSPSGSPVSRQQFVTDLVAIIDSDPDWDGTDASLGDI